MAAALTDSEAYQTTYRRDYTLRTLEMTGSLPQSVPAPVKAHGNGSEPHKRPRRRARRPAEASSLSQTGGGFILPGRSLTVGPAPGVPRAAPHGDERDHQVSEALRVDLPDGDGTDYSQWLLSKLPEIVEKCCRQQEPPPRVIEVLPPPVRRKIRINVTSNPNRTSPRSRQEDRSDELPEGSTDEFVLDGDGLRQVHRSRSRSASRQRRRRRPSARRDVISSTSSLESAGRTATGDAATAELVRRVLEEMFGPRPQRPADGGAGSAKPTDSLSGHRNRSCQTSPRLTFTSAGSASGGGGGEETAKAAEGAAPSAAEVAAQTDSSALSPCRPPVVVRSLSPSPRPRDTSRRILDTLTESNRLLRQMSDFFRRAELNERITQRVELGDQLSPRLPPAGLPTKPAGWEASSELRHRTGDGWRYRGPPTDGAGTTRSDGGLWRGDSQPPDALRQCSDSELSARIRRYAAAAEQGLTVRSWEQQQQQRRRRAAVSPLPLGAARPGNGGDSAPSSARSWASAQLLELHSEDRPYRPLVSPPPREADTVRSDSEAGEGPRTSSPAVGPTVCSHRQAEAPTDIDSTDVLLSYDPWQAIENDFKSLLK